MVSGFNLFSRIVGGVVMGVGTVVTAGSSLQEMSNVKEKLKEALKVLEDDERYSKNLFEWLRDGSYVEEAINDIKNQVYGDLEEVVDELLQIYKERSAMRSTEVDKRIKNVLQMFHISPKQAEEIADVIGILLTIYMLRGHYRLLFKVASEGYKLFKGSFKMAHTAYELLEAANVVKNSTSALSSTKKLMLGLSMALHAVNIYLEAKNFDTFSEQVELIHKAVNQLRQEKHVFDDIYRDCNTLDSYYYRDCNTLDWY